MAKPGCRGLHHVALVVTDPDAALAFYRDVLGLSVVDATGVTEAPQCRSVACPFRREPFSMDVTNQPWTATVKDALAPMAVEQVAG